MRVFAIFMKMTKDSFKEKSVLAIGIGGFGCSCCDPFIGKRPKMRRLARRAMKAETRAAVDAYYEDIAADEKEEEDKVLYAYEDRMIADYEKSRYLDYLDWVDGVALTA